MRRGSPFCSQLKVYVNLNEQHKFGISIGGSEKLVAKYSSL